MISKETIKYGLDLNIKWIEESLERIKLLLSYDQFSENGFEENNNVVSDCCASSYHKESLDKETFTNVCDECGKDCNVILEKYFESARKEMKEFNLSDKIEPVRGRLNMSSVDVKEAVKRLKEVLKDNTIYPNLTHNEVIDKIFGEKLI